MHISSRNTLDKVFILLPDGVGLRNFIYTDFLEYGNAVVWTPLDYLDDAISQKRLPEFSVHKSSDIYKSALIKANLLYQYKRTSNSAFLSYILPSKSKKIKYFAKNAIIDLLAKIHASQSGLKKLRRYYVDSLKKSEYYDRCSQQLREASPDFVFCTNQRMLNAAAPILAARDLGIPTGTFIFSWDNLPKGNLSVPAEHLFVWSKYMKEEVKKYYPYIDQNKVHVVGTPQFIPYTDKSLYESRETFCRKYGLDPNAKIVCFSGDDITTSPYDPVYLEDTAKAVRQLNKNGNYQILFRRCPVDFSDRYDRVLNEYKDVIKVANPLWEKPKDSKDWNSVIPTPEDMALLVNTVLHCETAVNVGSTIAHDFAAMGKTSCYINYNPVETDDWDIHKIYKFIHFESMKGLKPVYWMDNTDTITETLYASIHDKDNKVTDAKKWLNRIVEQPIGGANQRIWDKINMLVEGRVCT